MAKNIAENHLLLEALPAVQTWTANYKRDRKAVVMWHFAVCGFHEKSDAKVSNNLSTEGRSNGRKKELDNPGLVDLHVPISPCTNVLVCGFHYLSVYLLVHSADRLLQKPVCVNRHIILVKTGIVSCKGIRFLPLETLFSPCPRKSVYKRFCPRLPLFIRFTCLFTLQIVYDKNPFVLIATSFSWRQGS